MTFTKGQKIYFTHSLISWHELDNDRSLPWKEEKDPYRIWLSEIILQQTRAEQGLPYYLRFLESYPSIEDLAAAADEEVFRLWQGLGYYNRCKNLLGTARHVAGELGGKFPTSHEALLQLKGIGPYTAAAIASFAFGLPHAVVDGNVNRVLSRYFGIDTPYDSTEGKKIFRELASDLLHKQDSAAYNQAIMDLGATVCTPAVPKCSICPLSSLCFAYKNHLTGSLPVKAKKPAVRNRYFHYILITCQGKLWIHKRTGKDIWQNLYQPLLIESNELLDASGLMKHTEFKALKLPGKLRFEAAQKQKLTHQIISSRCFSIHLDTLPAMPANQGLWVDLERLKNYAFPRSLVSFLEKKLYF